MTDEQINIAISEACEVKPVLVEWWAFKEDEKGGRVCFHADTKCEVEKWIDSLPEGSWAKDYIPKAFYRYPDYCNDLNAMHEAEKTLDFEQAELFEDELCDVTFKNNKRLENPPPWRFSVCHATARQRAEAFIRTLGIFSYEQPMQKMAKPINKQCPHCGIICSPKHYSGWHGDKCKVAITIPSTQRKKVDG
jgi:hypothetical protein